uniref:Protein NO VEIN C-terminal domain-containing protein n=1 Tax=Chlamydomonas leiostraca TaxID=1034604 RepID=A0A7S0X0N7_9CHLO
MVVKASDKLHMGPWLQIQQSGTGGEPCHFTLLMRTVKPGFQPRVPSDTYLQHATRDEWLGFIMERLECGSAFLPLVPLGAGAGGAGGSAPQPASSIAADVSVAPAASDWHSPELKQLLQAMGKLDFLSMAIAPDMPKKADYQPVIDSFTQALLLALPSKEYQSRMAAAASTAGMASSQPGSSEPTSHGAAIATSAHRSIAQPASWLQLLRQASWVPTGNYAPPKAPQELAVFNAATRAVFGESRGNGPFATGSLRNIDQVLQLLGCPTEPSVQLVVANLRDISDAREVKEPKTSLWDDFAAQEEEGEEAAMEEADDGQETPDYLKSGLARSARKVKTAKFSSGAKCVLVEGLAPFQESLLPMYTYLAAQLQDGSQDTKQALAGQLSTLPVIGPLEAIVRNVGGGVEELGALPKMRKGRNYVATAPADDLCWDDPEREVLFHTATLKYCFPLEVWPLLQAAGVHASPPPKALFERHLEVYHEAASHSRAQQALVALSKLGALLLAEQQQAANKQAASGPTPTQPRAPALQHLDKRPLKLHLPLQAKLLSAAGRMTLPVLDGTLGMGHMWVSLLAAKGSQVQPPQLVVCPPLEELEGPWEGDAPWTEKWYELATLAPPPYLHVIVPGRVLTKISDGWSKPGLKHILELAGVQQASKLIRRVLAVGTPGSMQPLSAAALGLAPQKQPQAGPAPAVLEDRQLVEMLACALPAVQRCLQGRLGMISDIHPDTLSGLRSMRVVMVQNMVSAIKVSGIPQAPENLLLGAEPWQAALCSVNPEAASSSQREGDGRTIREDTGAKEVPRIRTSQGSTPKEQWLLLYSVPRLSVQAWSGLKKAQLRDIATPLARALLGHQRPAPLGDPQVFSAEPGSAAQAEQELRAVNFLADLLKAGLDALAAGSSYASIQALMERMADDEGLPPLSDRQPRLQLQVPAHKVPLIASGMTSVPKPPPKASSIAPGAAEQSVRAETNRATGQQEPWAADQQQRLGVQGGRQLRELDDGTYDSSPWQSASVGGSSLYESADNGRVPARSLRAREVQSWVFSQPSLAGVQAGTPQPGADPGRSPRQAQAGDNHVKVDLGPSVVGRQLSEAGRQLPKSERGVSATVLKEIGNWGEHLAYRYLRHALQDASDGSARPGGRSQRGPAAALRRSQPSQPGSTSTRVTWVNQREESGLPYDIKVEQVQGSRVVSTQYIEVKTTVAPVSIDVHITKNEMDAAMEHREQYMLALVTRAGTEEPGLEFIKDPVELWQSRQAEVRMRIL